MMEYVLVNLTKTITNFWNNNLYYKRSYYSFIIEVNSLLRSDKRDNPSKRWHTSQEKTNESHHMGNAWVFPSISHGMGKCNKTHRMGRTWEIGNHTFPIVWVLFSHLIPILWYTSSYGKCMGFPINFP